MVGGGVVLGFGRSNFYAHSTNHSDLVVLIVVGGM